MPELINLGYIYIAQPPIFGLKKKNSRSPKVERYIYDEKALSASTRRFVEYVRGWVAENGGK